MFCPCQSWTRKYEVITEITYDWISLTSKLQEIDFIMNTDSLKTNTKMDNI